MGSQYSRRMIVPKCKLYDIDFQKFTKDEFALYDKKDDKFYFHIGLFNPMGKTKYVYKNQFR